MSNIRLRRIQCTLFEDIDNFLNEPADPFRASSPSPSPSHSQDSFDSTLEAFDNSQIVVPNNRLKSSYANSQLYDIQKIFAQFDEYTDKRLQSNLSTECTSENSYQSYYSYQPEQIFNSNQMFDFEINPDKIYEDNRATLMLRNIPTDFTRDMLIEEINTKFTHKYDFLNLPFDFRTRQNAGYAFINFKEKSSVSEFYSHFNGRRWKCNMNFKPCLLRYARVQGKQRLINCKKSYKQNIYQQNDNFYQIQQIIQSQVEIDFINIQYKEITM